jgi:hypothetical protein
MNTQQWTDWRARLEDELDAIAGEHAYPTAVRLYITDQYTDSDEWRARETEFIEAVEAEAQDLFEERGEEALRTRRDLIDETIAEQQEDLRRLRLPLWGMELVASQCRTYYGDCAYGDCAGRVADELEVVPRGALVPDFDGPHGDEGVRAPTGPLVLRPSGPEYTLEPTERLLEARDLPTDAVIYSFDVLRVAAEDTWEDVTALVEEQVEIRKQITRNPTRELKHLRARRSVYTALLEHRASGRPMPWEGTGTDAYPSTSDCVQAVVDAAREVDTLSRQTLLKKAARRLGLQYESPHKKLKGVLDNAELYPTGDGPGRPPKQKSQALAEEMLDRCRAWLQQKTK